MIRYVDADGNATRLTFGELRLLIRQQRDVEAQMARERRAAVLRTVREDRATAARFLREEREMERSHAQSWAILRARVRKPSKAPEPEGRRVARDIRRPRPRRLPTYSKEIIDTQGRRGIYYRARYVSGRKGASYVGCAKAVWRYMIRDGAFEHDAAGVPSVISNMGADALEVGAACDLLESVQRAERANAKLFTTIEVNLPHDISPEARVVLLHRFCEDAFGAFDLPYAAVVHHPPEGGDQRNTHAHIMVWWRPVVRTAPYEWQVAKDLATEHDSIEMTMVQRGLFAEAMTWASQAEGRRRVYTGLSHAQRGLAIKPTIKIGKDLTELHRRGERVALIERNEQTIRRNEAILEAERLRGGIAQVEDIRRELDELAKLRAGAVHSAQPVTVEFPALARNMAARPVPTVMKQARTVPCKDLPSPAPAPAQAVVIDRLHTEVRYRRPVIDPASRRRLFAMYRSLHVVDDDWDREVGPPGGLPASPPTLDEIGRRDADGALVVNGFALVLTDAPPQLERSVAINERIGRAAPIRAITLTARAGPAERVLPLLQNLFRAPAWATSVMTNTRTAAPCLAGPVAVVSQANIPLRASVKPNTVTLLSLPRQAVPVVTGVRPPPIMVAARPIFPRALTNLQLRHAKATVTAAVTIPAAISSAAKPIIGANVIRTTTRPAQDVLSPTFAIARPSSKATKVRAPSMPVTVAAAHVVEHFVDLWTWIGDRQRKRRGRERAAPAPAWPQPVAPPQPSSSMAPAMKPITHDSANPNRLSAELVEHLADVALHPEWIEIHGKRIRYVGGSAAFTTRRCGWNGDQEVLRLVAKVHRCATGGADSLPPHIRAQIDKALAERARPAGGMLSGLIADGFGGAER